MMVNSIIEEIKNVVRTVRDQILWGEFKIRIKNAHKRNNATVIFIATPIHGNLGDQAIVYSQYLFFELLDLKAQIIEIHRYQYELWREKIQQYISPSDLIIIDGGGSMGTLWPEEEHKMQDVVLRFRQNPIFIFPQTASYADDMTGKEEIEQSRKAYSANNRLFIFARDKGTLDILQNEMPEVRCMYTPDMVMFIEGAQTEQKREGVAFCLREDTERVLTEEQRSGLKKRFASMGVSTREISTIVRGAVWKFQRKKVLQKKWNEFSSVQLVVTDRLHGMVFSAITGTPCIALDNISHKVYGAYQWLNYLPYLRFCSSIDEVEEAAKELLELPPQNYNLEPLLPYYNEMRNVVKNAIENVEQVPNGD